MVELLKGLQQVGLGPHHRPHLTRLVVPHIDALILIQGGGSPGESNEQKMISNLEFPRSHSNSAINIIIVITTIVQQGSFLHTCVGTSQSRSVGKSLWDHAPSTGRQGSGERWNLYGGQRYGYRDNEYTEKLTKESTHTQTHTIRQDIIKLLISMQYKSLINF